MKNYVLKCACFFIVIVVVGAQFKEDNTPDDNSTNDWKLMWTWKLGEWPNTGDRNDTDGGDLTPRMFPNVTSEMLMTPKASSAGSNCVMVSEYPEADLRVYQCTVTLPGLDVKSDDSCMAVSGKNDHGCDWHEDNVTVCHRWRDLYTQSITFCKSTEDPCADDDDRLMMCACSVYYAWNTGQYYTYCDCQGPTGFYIDGCAISYFGLLDTPTEARTCRTVCSRRSECKECRSGATLSSPGVATFCMCETISSVYGTREICPCQDEHLDDTACSDDYDPFMIKRQCQPESTTVTTTTTTRLQTTSDGPGVNVSPDERGNPSVIHSSKATTENLEGDTTTHDYTTTERDHTTASTSDWSTLSDQLRTTDGLSNTSRFPRTKQQHETTFVKSTKSKGRKRPQSRGLSYEARMGIIFGLLAILTLLLLVLIVLSLCCECRCYRGRRKRSTSETVPRAEEFTGWIEGTQEHSGPTRDVLSNTNISTGPAEDNGPYYKDYFQVVERDGSDANSESPYYFKIADKPNEAAKPNVLNEDGNEMQSVKANDKQVQDLKQVPPVVTKIDPVKNDNTNTANQVPVSKQEPVSTKIESVKTDDTINIKQASDVTDESPYYFKYRPDTQAASENAFDENNKSAVNGYQALDLSKAKNDATEITNSESPTECKNEAGYNVHQGNEINSYLRQISNKSDGSASYLKLQDNNDYFFLLKPEQSQQCSTDLNGDYFPLQKTGHLERPNTHLCSIPDTEDNYFPLMKKEVCPTDLNGDYFPLQKTGHLGRPHRHLCSIPDTEYNYFPLMKAEVCPRQNSMSEESNDNMYQFLDTNKTKCLSTEVISNDSIGNIKEETSNEIGSNLTKASGEDVNQASAVAASTDELPEHDYYVVDKELHGGD